MPKIVFVAPSGEVREIEAPVGISVMEAAKQRGVAGILAQCGGACACATCHVYVDPGWVAKLPSPEDMEQGMLESAWEPKPNSRLSCQITVTAALEGLRLVVPERQG
jgi:2Fe-2S ferredoxin